MDTLVANHVSMDDDRPIDLVIRRGRDGVASVSTNSSDARRVVTLESRPLHTFSPLTTLPLNLSTSSRQSGGRGGSESPGVQQNKCSGGIFSAQRLRPPVLGSSSLNGMQLLDDNRMNHALSIHNWPETKSTGGQGYHHLERVESMYKSQSEGSVDSSDEGEAGPSVSQQKPLVSVNEVSTSVDTTMLRSEASEIDSRMNITNAGLPCGPVFHFSQSLTFSNPVSYPTDLYPWQRALGPPTSVLSMGLASNMMTSLGLISEVAMNGTFMSQPLIQQSGRFGDNFYNSNYGNFQGFSNFSKPGFNFQSYSSVRPLWGEIGESGVSTGKRESNVAMRGTTQDLLCDLVQEDRAKRRMGHQVSYEPQRRSSDRGLKQISALVASFVRERGMTTYNEVAKELIKDCIAVQEDGDEEVSSSGRGAEEARNIKRRVYDVLNVLVAVGVIERGGDKLIQWKGGPASHSMINLQLLQEKKRKITARIEKKKKEVEELKLQEVCYKNLLAHNRSSTGCKHNCSRHHDDVSSYYGNSAGVESHGNQETLQRGKWSIQCNTSFYDDKRPRVGTGCHSDAGDEVSDGYHDDKIRQGDAGCHGNMIHQANDHLEAHAGCHGNAGCFDDADMHEEDANIHELRDKTGYYGDGGTISSRVYIPFVVVTANQETRINCNLSHDRRECLVEFSNSFQIHSHGDVIKQLNRSCRSCSSCSKCKTAAAVIVTQQL